MSRKCPSCGMESADAAQWCDFCKEPFRRKEAPAPPPPPPPSAAPKLRYSLPPTVSAQERAAKAPGAPAPAPAAKADELPPEAKEKLTAALAVERTQEPSAAPKWVRWAAWAFLGIWFVAGMILAGVMVGRQKLQESRPESAAPAP